MHSPTKSDFSLLKRILRYVKGTLHMGFYTSRNIRICLSQPSVTATVLAARKQDAPQQGFVLFLDQTWSHGLPKDSLMCLGPPQGLNTEHFVPRSENNVALGVGGVCVLIETQHIPAAL